LSLNDSIDRPLPPFRPGDETTYSWQPLPPPPRTRGWVYVLLLVLTVVTTTFMGALHYFSFSLGFNPDPAAEPAWSDPAFYMSGLWYAGTILAILGCHEMGHYVACRRYRVDATLPFFLPAPPPVLTGTFGAVIRIRSRIPSKLALFDIGIAGPIAGFVVAVPALFIGLALSRIERVPEDFQGFSLGEPLLFQWVAWLLYGDVGDGLSINLHPMGLAAWFGLIVTALNLFPIGQLDGGHIAYAVFGRRSIYVTIVTAIVAVALTFTSSSYLLFTILIIGALFLFGPHHPPTLDDHVPLARGRRLLAAFALFMLVVCFTAAPIELFVSGQ
jgi:membrane-associated protease RseP (regulator of RpoE activity)